MTNSQDRKWVAEGLKHWDEVVRRKPRDRKAREQQEMFLSWAIKLGIEKVDPFFAHPVGEVGCNDENR